VLRNLQITVAYGHLAHAFHQRAPGGANWCTFATWAAKQAGCTIRKEDVSRAVGRHFRSRLDKRALGRQLVRMPGLSAEVLATLVAQVSLALPGINRAADAVARGNLKVFEEIGRGFAQVLEGGPAPDGADLLRRAFVNYETAVATSDPTVRSQATFLANVQIGLHEQTRLQPEIARAVGAPLTTVRDLGARVLHALIPSSRHLPRLLQTPAYAAVGWLAMQVHRAATAITREVVTEAMMVLALPTGVLALGRNLEAPLPAIFRGSPHSVLAVFIKEYDPCPPGTSECGADDWCNLRQRMHYILHLFRAYAEEPRLWGRPFTPEQFASFKAGAVPAGEL
jgi:hypothetical protein